MLSKMRKHFATLLASSALVATLITSASAATPAQDAKGAGNTVPGELIVKFKATATDAEIQHGMKLGHLKVTRHLQTETMKARGHNGITLVQTDLAVDEAIAQP